MNDLITAATSGLFVEVGKVIEHMKAQQERIAELESKLEEAEDLIAQTSHGAAERISEMQARLDAALSGKLAQAGLILPAKWQDRLPICPSREHLMACMESEITELRAALAAAALYSPAVVQADETAAQRDLRRAIRAIELASEYTPELQGGRSPEAAIEVLAFELAKLREASAPAVEQQPQIVSHEDMGPLGTRTVKAYKLTAPQAADTDKVREALASIGAARIDAVWEAMPGGLNGFLKQFGYQQFAYAILDLAADVIEIEARKSATMAAQAPVRDKNAERWAELMAADNSTILHFYNTRPDLRIAFVDALPAAPAHQEGGNG